MWREKIWLKKSKQVTRASTSKLRYDPARLKRFFLRQIQKYKQTKAVTQEIPVSVLVFFFKLDRRFYAMDFYAWVFFDKDDDKNETIRGKIIKCWNQDILWVIATLRKKKIIIKTSKADSATLPYKPCCIFSWLGWLSTFMSLVSFFCGIF